ncbi:MAG: transglutaminase domain-containing protein [Proteobacteria bacterium]|nr:transglutaminase domain-containing protein [Pseudomonadota bacterium]
MSPLSKKAALLAVLLIFLPACHSESRKPAIVDGEFKSLSILQDEWMEAFFQGKKIGYVHGVTSSGTLGGKEVQQVKSFAHIEMEVEGDKTFTQLEQTAYLDKDGHLFAFDYRQNIMEHRMSVRGERRGDKFFVEINAGDRRSKLYDWSKNLYTSVLLKQALLDRKLKVGEEAVFDVLLEPLLAVEKVTVKLMAEESGFFRGEKTKLYRFEERFKGIVGELILTAEGDTVEEVSPNGFRLVRAEKVDALAPAAPLSMAELLLSTRVKSNIKLQSPRDIKTLRVMLKNVPSDYPFIDDIHQSVVETVNKNDSVDYLLNVVSQPVPERVLGLPARDGSFEIYLGADHVINSDNKKILGLSREIAGSETSALEVARKIYSWMDSNIGKRLVDTVSALDTLKSGEGECQAHANLYAALARAAGLPTKVISGIVYSTEYEGFMYHAWNEVWVGKWLAIDTILGGFPADATHIKLAEGSFEAQLRIMALIGKIEIEIINRVSKK